jgi:hypothetical protein
MPLRHDARARAANSFRPLCQRHFAKPLNRVEANQTPPWGLSSFPANSGRRSISRAYARRAARTHKAVQPQAISRNPLHSAVSVILEAQRSMRLDECKSTAITYIHTPLLR